MVVLGISLGTSTSGIAVISNGELIFWHTHSFRKKWSKKKAEKIAICYERYILQYQPISVVVKIPPWHHHSDGLGQLIDKVKTLFEYHGCMVEYKTKEEVKAVIPGVNNHLELMRHIVVQYPILQPEYERALAGKQRYHAKLFDAVIAAEQGKELLSRNKQISTR